ncbi:MAG: UTP--glucose-1-phosphate uridylyltransferase [Roseburia sp.]|nr:UTP--glucose-1-phosphate uridylyltransferase [Anaeroplasma bactoclasticum]MCM1196098.1 UTP--glucose-1-phosphate uridylyltransferase [Roseburia sp.]MCM1557338.1 UTP--glucose-1-phosphate uridylyltransferase [Anaeroplasma bactoclasticum]
MKPIRKAVIPAAGFGTRFLPFTKAVPKEMLPIVDIPTIEYIVREAIESGIEEVLIIINSEKECIRTHFGHNIVLENFLKSKNKTKELEIVEALPKQIHVEFTYQEEQLGLGHAVLCAEEFAKGEPFALLLGDDVYVGRTEPATKQLINAYNQTGSSILGTLVVPDEDVSKYGICKPRSSTKDALVELESVVEKPAKEIAPSNLAIGGRYVLTPAIFDYLKTQTKGAGGEIQLTDSILRLMSKEKVYSLAIDGRRYDIGSKKGFLEATIDFSLNREDLSSDMKEILKMHK